MKTIDISGIGNAMVDVLVEVDENQLNNRGFERGTMRLVDESEQQELLRKLGVSDFSMVSGGSVANSIIAASELGANCGFLCLVGDDIYGEHFAKEFKELNISLPNKLLSGEASGTSLVMITPDAERTMRTNLGIGASLSDSSVNEQLIEQSKWLLIEGYLLSNGESGQSAVRRASSFAKQAGTLIALSASEAWVVNQFSESFKNTLEQTDLLFANEEEACAITGADSFEYAFSAMKEKVPNYIISGGAKGAKGKFDGEEVSVDAFNCSPVDLTGAGDMLAGSFLYGITSGLSLSDALHRASWMASKVICQVGARLQTNPKEQWNSFN